MSFNGLKRTAWILGLALLTGLTQCKPSKEKPEQMTRIQEQDSVPLGDTSRTSVDWNGTYYGFLPCADCGGILTELVLESNGSYLMKRVYWGKDQQVITSEGTFQWDGSGGKIRLGDSKSKDEVVWYQVGENRLFQLDRKGNRNESDLAERYQLSKQNSLTGIEGVYWKLVELGGQPIEDGAPSAPFLMLVPGSGRVNGNGGCNTIMGGYELTDNNRISFSQFASTMMACPGENPEQEFLKVFDQVDNYTLKRDTLSLNKARMAPLARFVAAFP